MHKELFTAALTRWMEHRYPQTPQLGDTLWEACRYALSGGGKQLRPQLLLTTVSSLGKDPACGLLPALALEMIHTYSLVHDDLPICDDDPMRRGRPSVHIAFDDATALLVGDALLTDAWALLASYEDAGAATPEQRLAYVKVLAEAAGSQGIVWGQALDIHWTGRSGSTHSVLETIHQKKTAELIAAACVMGGIAAAADAVTLEALRHFGMKIGIAFQIIDDLLDDSATTGKSQGKDLEQGKLCYTAVMPRDEAHTLAQQLTYEAFAALEHIALQTSALAALAEKMLHRRH